MYQSQPMIPPPPIKARGMLVVVGDRMGVYGPPGEDGTHALQSEYRLMPDGWRIVIDPIPQLEAGG